MRQQSRQFVIAHSGKQVILNRFFAIPAGRRDFQVLGTTANTKPLLVLGRILEAKRLEELGCIHRIRAF